MLRIFGLILPAALVVASPAFAHTGISDTDGLADGLTHAIGGFDHVLAMIAVGLFAALLGGWAVWFVPASFVGMMAVGGALGMAGINLPFVEVGIGLSVVALGAAIALEIKLPVAAAMAFVGFFAIFHGYAHGAEMPDTASGIDYGIGFMLATAILHAVGVGLGLAIEQLGRLRVAQVARATGGTIAVAGIIMLAQAI
jgi:urease accessory protein